MISQCQVPEDLETAVKKSTQTVCDMTTDDFEDIWCRVGGRATRFLWRQTQERDVWRHEVLAASQKGGCVPQLALLGSLFMQRLRMSI